MLLCATRRGRLVLEKLAALRPDCEYLVVSFREEPWEPPFLEDIRALAESIGAQFLEARTPNDGKLPGPWRSRQDDLMLLTNWRYRLAPSFYARARLGAYVFHDAMLPKYRGFSPTVWAMVNGEDHTGVTLFRIAEGIDRGEIVDQRPVPIGSDETIGVVMERVTETYLSLLEDNIQALLGGTVLTRPQDESLATYCCKRTPVDDRIDWTWSTRRIHDLVRAVSDPYPGAHTTLGGRPLRVWSASSVDDLRSFIGRIPGQVCDVRSEGVIVLTGDGGLMLREVQLEGGARVGAAQVLANVGHTLGR